jgi:perosamine synthetase
VSNLAIHGGTAVRSSPYPGGPCLDDAERDAVQKVLDSGVLSGFIGTPGDHFFGGPAVRDLEAHWAALGEYRNVVSVNSATAALHAGMVGLGLPKGAEVVVPPLTMSATVAAALMCGLVPRFADLDPHLFTLTAETVEPVLTDRTAAIAVVHLFGQMAPMEGLRSLAQRRGLRVLEDAAQAPAATQHGVAPGADTAGAIYSLNQHKTITCGEGGLLATNDDTVAARARLVRNHAESTVGQYPDIDPVGLVGWNYRLTEIDAAIALSQTGKLERLTNHRVALAAQLRAGLEDLPGLVSPSVLPGNQHVYFTFATRFDRETWGCTREQFVAALQAEGVPCAAGYVDPLHRLPLFSKADRLPDGEVPVAVRLAEQELVLLPVCRHPATSGDIDHVIEALHKCWHGRAELGTVR